MGLMLCMSIINLSTLNMSTTNISTTFAYSLLLLTLRVYQNTLRSHLSLLQLFLFNPIISSSQQDNL